MVELTVTEEGERVKVPARVVWVRRPRRLEYQIGLEFAGATREQLDRISKLACRASGARRAGSEQRLDATASVEIEDLYAILGVRASANEDEIRQAFRKLAREYHPDHSSAPDASSRFTLLSKAYKVMRDPEMRRRYDVMRARFKAA
jgi:hypothetical protein